MHKVYFGIGGNLGNKKENLLSCIELIEKHIGFISSVSSIYETLPWGFDAQNNFWNQVLIVQTKLQAQELLLAIKKIEDKFQKKDAQDAYASREMDVDILMYDQKIINTVDLIIPHPHMHKRNFVLVPMAEIASDEHHPIFHKTMLELLDKCGDKSSIEKV